MGHRKNEKCSAPQCFLEASIFFSTKKMKSWTPMGFQSVFLLWAGLCLSKIHMAMVISCSAWMRPAVLGGPEERKQLLWVFRQLKPGKQSFSLNQL